MKIFPNPDVIISLYETAVDAIDPALSEGIDRPRNINVLSRLTALFLEENSPASSISEVGPSLPRMRGFACWVTPPGRCGAY